MSLQASADTVFAMVPDLRCILDGWEYEPGKISVRKIIGYKGREKLQTRIDMGILQIELDGRPDGQRPEDHESYLNYLEHRLAKHATLYGDDDDFVLTSENCQELRHEAYLYYQRYLSLFVLEDYDRVVRDTGRNLRVIGLCEQYAASREDRLALSAQRPYVLMMNTRARAYDALQSGNADAALAAVDAGFNSLRAAVQLDEDADDEGGANEFRILAKLREEILDKMPADAPARLEWELATALEQENYEKAAELRDALTRQRKPVAN